MSLKSCFILITQVMQYVYLRDIFFINKHSFPTDLHLITYQKGKTMQGTTKYSRTPQTDYCCYLTLHCFVIFTFLTLPHLLFYKKIFKREKQNTNSLTRDYIYALGSPTVLMRKYILFSYRV